uniref:Acyl_transf_3 domain-containing protein n=1 Tax=Syphacia muris TaxID=451379 RepID=A0A0N5AR27_9BILA
MKILYQSTYQDTSLSAKWLLLLLLIVPNCLSELQHYDPEKVMHFLDEMSKRAMLSELPVFLNASSIVAEQLEYFTTSYATGFKSNVLGRDQFRWAFNMQKCYKVSAEQSNVVSEFPMDYCFINKKTFTSVDNAFGICIPSTCVDNSAMLLIEWQNTVLNVTESVSISDIWCGKSRKRTIWYKQPLVILDYSYSTIITLLVGLATAYHCSRNPDQLNDLSLELKILLSFSLKKNARRLFETKTETNTTIRCIYGIRFLSLCWVIMGHVLIVLPSYVDNLTEYRQESKKLINQYASNSTLSVDTFFLLTGLLASYLFFIKCQSNEFHSKISSLKFWCTFIAIRALRLWPAYVFSLLNFSLRWSELSVSTRWPGNFVSATCSEDWWKNLLFLNGILESACMSWTWFIGTTFVYSLISPLYLYTYSRSLAYGLVLSLLTVLFSMLLNAWTMTAYNFPPLFIPFDAPPKYYVDDLALQNAIIYIRPEFRVGPFIVGIVFGVLMFKTQQKNFQLNFYTAAFGWSIILILAVFSLYGSYPILMAWHWKLYDITYGCSHRTLWAVVVGWVIYACHFGYGSFINKFLCWKLFVPLSNMCYSIYLLHAMAVVAIIEAQDFPLKYPHKTGIVFIYAQVLLLALLIGLVTVLLVEFPADNLVRLLLLEKRSIKPVKNEKLQLSTLTSNGIVVIHYTASSK